MADQFTVLPGEVLISRNAVMAPASMDGAQSGEEPDMVVGSNRELVVRDVTPESCNLEDFGLSEICNCEVPKIDTLMVKVLTGDLDSQDEDLNVEKLWVPVNFRAPFFISLTFSFFLICQALFFSKTKDDCLLIIKYL